MLSYTRANLKEIKEDEFFTRVKSLFQDKLKYVIEHTLYLERIKRGMVDNAEMNDYFLDVFNMVIKPDQLTATLLTFNNFFDLRQGMYVQLLNVMKIQDKTLCYLTLGRSIEFLLRIITEVERYEQEVMPPHLFAPIRSVFDDRNTFKNIFSDMKHLLPASYETLTKIVVIETNSQRKYSNDIMSKIPFVKCKWSVIISLMRGQFPQMFKFANSYTPTAAIAKDVRAKTNPLEQVIKDIKVLEQKVKQKQVMKPDPARVTHEMSKLTSLLGSEAMQGKSFAEVSQFVASQTDGLTDGNRSDYALLFEYSILSWHISQCIESEKKIKFDSIHGPLKMLQIYVADFYRALPTIIKLNFENSRDVEIQGATKLYSKCILSIHGELDLMLSKCQKLASEIDMLPDSAQLLNFKQQLNALMLELKEKYMDWPQDIPRQIETVSTLEIARAKFKNRLVMIGDEIKSLRRTLREYVNVEEGKLARNREPEVNISASQQEHDDSAAREFKQIQAKKIKDYKEYVIRLRVEKERIKREKKTEQSISSSASSLLDSQFSLYKNATMEQRLAKLNHTYFDLMLDILNQRVGVRYADVRNLIVTHLGGKVIEIGNGSSHKRFEIDKYIVEVLSHAQIEDELSKSMLVTGGLYKPHGRAHNTGILSPFNLGMIKRVFESAGITMPLIAGLRERKEHAYVEKKLQQQIMV